MRIEIRVTTDDGTERLISYALPADELQQARFPELHFYGTCLGMIRNLMADLFGKEAADRVIEDVGD